MIDLHSFQDFLYGLFNIFARIYNAIASLSNNI